MTAANLRARRLPWWQGVRIIRRAVQAWRRFRWMHLDRFERPLPCRNCGHPSMSEREHLTHRCGDAS